MPSDCYSEVCSGERYWEVNLNEIKTPSSCDVTIIGAGLGGLTAAALLSKAGFKVCVLEKELRYGGYLAGFRRNGFQFETAIHWLNQCNPEGMTRKVFNHIAPDAPPTPIIKRIRRYKSEVSDYLLTNNPDAMRDTLIADFPDEREAITRFFEAARAVGDIFPKMSMVYRNSDTLPLLRRASRGLSILWTGIPLLRYTPHTVEKGFTKTFKSQGLRQTFQAGDRLTSCLVPVAWAYSSDFQQIPKGGSRAFPVWLAGILEQHGATLACGCEVKKIEVEGKRATRVIFSKNGETHEVSTRYIVAACDMISLYRDLLPEGTVTKRRLEKMVNADIYKSGVTVSLGLDRPLQDFGLNEEQIFLTRSDIPRPEQQNSDPNKTELSVVPNSIHDPAMAPPGGGVMTIYASSAITDHDNWKTERGEDGSIIRGPAYRDMKQVYADSLIKRVEQNIAPGFTKHIAHCDVATPITYHRYTGNFGGAIMGFRPSATNVRARFATYRTPIENIFIGGQWAEIGGGVPNTVKAAVNSTLFILKKESPETFRALCEVVDP